MLTLKLDTTTAKIARAEVWQDEKLLAQRENSQPLVSITQALQKSNLDLEQIDNFTANPGPGSYTGIRVGIAVANSLNWALGKKTSALEPIYE